MRTKEDVIKHKKQSK